jgi:hypothetical protein
MICVMAPLAVGPVDPRKSDWAVAIGTHKQGYVELPCGSGPPSPPFKLVP